MIDLREIPLFASLPEAALQALRQRFSTRRYAEGEVILRAGDAAKEMHLILEGTARVELGAGGTAERRTVLAAPGQTLGEMSLLSTSPVSATVVAQREVTTLVLRAEDLADLLDAEPTVYREFAALLVERLRHRTDGRASQLRPALAVLAGDTDDASDAVAAIAKGVAHYSPGSERLDLVGMDGAAAARIERWRQEGPGNQFLVIPIAARRYPELRSALRPGDALVRITADPGIAGKPIDAGPADVRTVLLGARSARPPDGAWVDFLAAEELTACRRHEALWTRIRYPTVDRIARFITYREVGVAMSVGAAAGFAHLGFLDVLERSGVPIDYVCGSSMGGAVALCFAAFGTAPAATDALCRFGMEFASSRGLQILPRSALVSKHRIHQLAQALFGDSTFADLALPAAVVAADLVAGQRVILDRGPVSAAAQATVAIPGLLPPVRIGNRILVDGGLVTRVPADLLAHRRCGLRIANVVVPLTPDSQPRLDEEAERLQARLDQPLGFRAALGAAWKLLGWWDCAAQAERADLVIRIGVDERDGFDFSAGRRIAELGRQATLRQADSIRSAVARLLTPGTP